jgi:hypothetical protein
MSAIKAVLADAIDHLKAAGEKLRELGHDGVARVEEILHELEGDAPKLADEAKTDAEQVVATAETQGLAPAEHEAAADGVQLAEDAGHDVVAAVEGSDKPAPAPAEPTA